jgi:N-acetylmuramoyl-L-alanine amidase
MRWNNSAMRLLLSVCTFCFACLSMIAQSPPSAPQGTTGTATQPTAPSPSAPANPVPAEKPLLILIDAAHGGTDAGALLTPTAVEKDITLNVARRLKQELNTRGIQVQLLRDGDWTLSADQRATTANTGDAALYISVHASSLGSGIRLFTAMLPSGGDNSGPFLDWDTAQAAALERSKAIQAQLVLAIQQTRFPVRALMAPLRPLNNIKSPAIAIEISPTTGDAAQVASTGYQQMICSAVGNALASLAQSLRTNTGSRP